VSICLPWSAPKRQQFEQLFTHLFATAAPRVGIRISLEFRLSADLHRNSN
jgi:hypothetical protein